MYVQYLACTCICRCLWCANFTFVCLHINKTFCTNGLWLFDEQYTYTNPVQQGVLLSREESVRILEIDQKLLAIEEANMNPDTLKVCKCMVQ